ncbi:DUF6985 domain-containing protein [Actinoplanes sp. CA-054009]
MLDITEDPNEEWHTAGPVEIPLLGGPPVLIILDGYADDETPADFHEAVRAFLTLDRSALEAAAPAIFAYYRDVADSTDAVDVEIDTPAGVLDHITLGREPTVSRDTYTDRRVCVSLECECAWEPEHGLQLVFRDGRTITKVGPYDGHLTNASAYADPSLTDVVYRS